MRPLLRLAAASLAALLALGASGAGAAERTPSRALRVVASIKPLHSLIAGVMSGHGAPALLVPSDGSPYGATIRASEAYLLSAADIVFWIGSPLEAGIEAPLAQFAGGARVVDLIRVHGLVRYKTRSGYWEAGTFGPAIAAHQPDAALWLGWYGSGGMQDAAAHYYVDPPIAAAAMTAETAPEPEVEEPIDLVDVDGHVWLDPLNAQLMIDRIVEVLSEADIENAPDYRRNGESVKSRLKRLDADLETMLTPARGRPFLVLHDAYQYMEVRYALAGTGSLKLMSDRPPDGERLAEIRHKIEARQAACVFGDPRVPSRFTAVAIEGTQARTAELDPFGAGLPDGIDLYFMMMRRLAGALQGCLAG